jgi:hypothetical protein
MLQIREIAKKYKEWLAFTTLFIVVLIFQTCNHPTKTNTIETSNANEGIDLLIPAGQSLVPIEVANYETLDSLLGPYGVVDLFFADPSSPGDGKKIASMVKILRAPKNPSHFAVLVPARLAPQILKYQGPFIVSVQNPKFQMGTKFEDTAVKTSRRSRILYE